MLGPDGERLAKRHGAVTLADRAALGQSAADVRDELAASLGLGARGEAPHARRAGRALLGRRPAGRGMSVGPHVAAGRRSSSPASCSRWSPGFSETGLEGGALLVAAGLSVWLLNLLYRVGVKGDRERDAEDRARAYFDEHGRWPDEERGRDAPLNT